MIWCYPIGLIEVVEDKMGLMVLPQERFQWREMQIILAEMGQPKLA